MQLKCLWCTGNRLQVLEEIPEGKGITIADGNWDYNGGEYEIGHGVRADQERQLLEGPVFIFDANDFGHSVKAEQILTEYEDHGHLVCA